MKRLARSSSMDGEFAHALTSRSFPPCLCQSKSRSCFALAAKLFDPVPLDQMTDAENALIEAATDIPGRGQRAIEYC